MTNEQIVIRIQAGEEEAENMELLWKQNKGFIAKLAMKYRGYAEMDDLQQEGFLGLCEAVRQYDPEQSIPFLYYAAFWIKQAMRRYIDNYCGVVKIPVYTKEWIRKYRKAVREYQAYYGVEPSDAALCAVLSISEEKLHVIREDERMGQIGSLSAPIPCEDEGLDLLDTISSGEDVEGDCIRHLDHQNMKRMLWEEVDALPDGQGRILRCRFIEGKTLKELGETEGAPQSAIRQKQDKALNALRLPKRSRKFKAYYEEYLSPAPIHHVGVGRYMQTWISEVERDALGL